MALIKFGGLVSEARGSLGATVYARNQYGAYVRPSPVFTAERTAKQITRATALVTASQLWRTLSEQVRMDWAAAAAKAHRTNVFGDSAPLTAFNYFVKAQLNAFTLDLYPLAPNLAEVTQQFPKKFNLVSATTAPSLLVNPNPDVLDANHYALLSATPCLDPSRKFVKNDYRQIRVCTPETDFTGADFGGNWATVFGNMINNATIWVKVVFINKNTCQASAAITGSTVVQEI